MTLNWNYLPVPGSNHGDAKVLTDHYDMAEDAATSDGGAVPATVPELFLTLDSAETHTVPYGDHSIGRRATHLTLSRRQAGNSPADHVGLQSSHDAGHHPESNAKP